MGKLQKFDSYQIFYISQHSLAYFIMIEGFVFRTYIVNYYKEY